MLRKQDKLSSDEFDNIPNAIKMPQNNANLSPRKYDNKYVVDNDNQISPPPSPSPRSRIRQSHKDYQIHIIGNSHNERDYMADHQNDQSNNHQQSQIPNRLPKINRKIKITQPIPAKPPISPRKKINNTNANKTESTDFNVNDRNDEIEAVIVKKCNNSSDIHPIHLPRIDSISGNEVENRSPLSSNISSLSSTFPLEQQSLPKIKRQKNQRIESKKLTFYEESENNNELCEDSEQTSFFENNLIKASNIMQSSSTENNSNDETDGEDERPNLQFNERISSNEIQNNTENEQEPNNNYENTSLNNLYRSMSSSDEIQHNEENNQELNDEEVSQTSQIRFTQQKVIEISILMVSCDTESYSSYESD